MLWTIWKKYKYSKWSCTFSKSFLKCWVFIVSCAGEKIQKRSRAYWKRMSVLFLTTLYTSGRIKKPKESGHTNIDLEMAMVNSNDFSPVHGMIPSNFCVELLFFAAYGICKLWETSFWSENIKL